MLRYLNVEDFFLIPTYNLLVAIGIATAMLFLQYEKDFKRKTDNEKLKIHFSILISIIGGFIGAFVFDAFFQNIALTYNNINKIGLTFFGGLIIGSFILAFCLKLFWFEVLSTLNLLTRPFCIAHFFGRFGCFMAGCCYGTPTKSIFGVIFPTGSLPHTHYHQLIKIHPTQLYECFFILLLFMYLSYTKSKNHFFIYILIYSVFRFLIEYIRADSRGIILNQKFFSPSQLVSILIIIVISSIFLSRTFLFIKQIKYFDKMQIKSLYFIKKLKTIKMGCIFEKSNKKLNI